MTKLNLLLASFLVFLSTALFAQSEKEEAFIKDFFEVVKKGDKTLLDDKFLLEDKDFETFTQSQQAAGGTQTYDKAAFKAFVEDRNKKILVGFDDMLKHAVTSKVEMAKTTYSSNKKIVPQNMTVVVSFYQIYFKYYDYTFKIKIEAYPMGDGIKISAINGKIFM
jgi:hypothetical protein